MLLLLVITIINLPIHFFHLTQPFIFIVIAGNYLNVLRETFPVGVN